MFLGRVAGDSGVHSVNAARDAGWLADGDMIPEAGSLKQLLQTTGYIHDFAAVVRIGDPLQPLQDLEIALLESPPDVRLVAVSSVESQWAWAAGADGAQTTVVLDEDAFQDCRSAIEELGLLPHVVPSSMTLEDRMRLASRGASLVIENSRIPAEWHAMPDSEALRGGGPIWYGLVRCAEPQEELESGYVVWLAFSPPIERAGGLRDVLGAFVECGINLKHLHSFRRTDGSYAFSCTFRVDGLSGERNIMRVLSEQQVNHRLLACFEGSDTEPAGRLLAPKWDHARSSAVKK